jgi:7-keto-8-aminopelargonate synthetase-like enzyme
MDLERKLGRAKGKKLVVVEGVYSMDGDVCTLPEIVEVAKRHGARILIDEAHSTFLFGPNGRGVAEHFGLDDQVDFHLGTFSKSLGGQGGFVCGSKDMVNYVNAFGRSRFFSCNLAPPLVAGLIAGLRIVEAEPELRATSLCRGGCGHRQVGVAGDARDGEQRREGVRGRRARAAGRAVPAACDLSGGAEAQVAPAYLSVGGPH